MSSELKDWFDWRVKQVWVEGRKRTYVIHKPSNTAAWDYGWGNDVTEKLREIVEEELT